MVDLTLPDAQPVPPPGPAEEPAVPAADDGIATERLIARVRAWQHRHPLARRIAAREVAGIGVIALPYGPAEGAPEGAAGPMRPLYHQPKLLPGLSHRALVAFAERHAVRQRPGSPAWPQRDIERADAAPEPAPETRYLLTAAIEGAAPRAAAATARRLLLAPEGPAVWGRRPLSRTMLTVAGVALAAVVGAGGWAARSSLNAAAVPPAESPARPLPAASAALGASAASTANTVVAGSAAASSRPAAATSTATSAAASTAAFAAPAAPSAPVARAAGASSSAALPASAPLSPAVPSAPARSASAPPAAAALPSASAAAVAVPEVVPPPKLLPMPGARSRADAPSAPASAAPAVAPGPHYALVSVPEKKRAAAEATLQRVHQLLGPAIGSLQAQVMPAPGGFVVTLWPLSTQADAEQLAAVLARRGVPMKWMEF